MAQGYDAFGSPIDGERPFTTAWGEYDPRQFNAWGNDGHIPDWAHPYDFNEKPSQRKYARQARTTSNSSVASIWENWHGVEKPSRFLAILLAVVLGTLGAHRFYIGDKKMGAAMAVVTLLSFGGFAWIIAIWGFIDAYKYYQMSDAEFDRYCYDARQVTA